MAKKDDDDDLDPNSDTTSTDSSADSSEQGITVRPEVVACLSTAMLQDLAPHGHKHNADANELMGACFTATLEMIKAFRYALSTAPPEVRFKADQQLAACCERLWRVAAGEADIVPAPDKKTGH